MIPSTLPATPHPVFMMPVGMEIYFHGRSSVAYQFVKLEGT
jgi:hypothetical protein